MHTPYSVTPYVDECYVKTGNNKRSAEATRGGAKGEVLPPKCDHMTGCFFFNSGLWGYWHCGQSWPIVPASGNSEDDCGEADGM
jgi:hypothetical protein